MSHRTPIDGMWFISVEKTKRIVCIGQIIERIAETDFFKAKVTSKNDFSETRFAVMSLSHISSIDLFETRQDLAVHILRIEQELKERK